MQTFNDCVQLVNCFQALALTLTLTLTLILLLRYTFYQRPKD